MERYVILYNPKAGNGRCKKQVRKLDSILNGAELRYCSVLKIEDYEKFFAGLSHADRVVIAGGDGTLNRFVNQTEGIDIRQELLFFPSGSGNDLVRDVEKKNCKKPFPVRQYIENLPVVTIDGQRTRFFNAIGYGIDGYCCEEGDRQRRQSKRRIHYSLIALKGLLYAFAPVNATVTVDGETRTYEKLWLAPTLKGRYYGGGFQAAPAQNRLDKEGKVTMLAAYGLGRLKCLTLFLSIMKGTHVRHQDVIDIRTGHHVTVSFDRPTALQIDGETVTGVTEYTVDA